MEKTQGMKLFRCNVCNFKANSMPKLEEHTKAVHLDKKDIQCPDCDFKTAWKRSMYDHRKLHEKGTLRMLSCNQCEFTTHNRGTLRTHRKVHDPVKDNMACEHCGKLFTRIASYQNHINIVHGNKLFSCDECDFTSKQKQAIKSHRLWKHTEDNKKFNCDFCQKGFVAKKDHKDHIESVHLGVKNYKCELCESEFYDKWNLQKHMKNHLADEDKLNCQFCPYVTPNRHILERHIDYAHTNPQEKQLNFKDCVLCDFVAKSGYDYKLHISSNHRGQLKCEFCDYKTDFLPIHE